MNYIGPGKQINIKKSILTNINDEVRRYSNYYIKDGQEIFGWGISDKNRWGSYNPSEGEYIGIYESGKEDTTLYIGKVISMIKSPDMSTEIWGKSTKEKVVLFEKERIIKVKKSNVYKVFNKEKVLQSMKRTEIDLSNIKEYELEVSGVIKEKEKYKQLKEQLLVKIELIEAEIDMKIDVKSNVVETYEKSIGLAKKKVANRGETDPNYPRNLIGLYGEKIVYRYLKDIIDNDIKNNDFLEKLDWTKNEIIEEIKFYNEGVKIKRGEFKDKSVGKGHDIKIITNIREIKLEIKSSRNKVNIFYISHNELLDMKEGGNNNYVVTVDEILRVPCVRIIKNFSTLYSDEVINMIIKQTIEISKIPNKYLV